MIVNNKQRLLLQVAVPSLLLSLTTTLAEEEQTCQWIDNTNICVSPWDQQPQCNLYMAPSTLGEGANLGMYAGTDIPKGMDIQQEIAIPFMFRDWDGPSFFPQYPNVTMGDQDDGALWYR